MKDADRTSRFADWIGQELDRAYRLAAVILEDAVEAEDAVHDAAVKAWRRFDTLLEPDRFPAWFGRILLNVCRDRLRQRQRRPVVDLSLLMADSGLHGTVADPTSAIVRQQLIAQALRRLAPDLLLVVVLRYEADLTVAAIADQLGIPEGTVKSRLSAGLERLRMVLTPEAPL